MRHSMRPGSDPRIYCSYAHTMDSKRGR